MNYRGEIIVGNDEGIRERYSWGTLNKLLCEETTADENFTFGEIEYDPRSLRGPVIGHEAFHCLRGTGVLRADPVDGISGGSVVVPLGPGTEYYVRGDVPRIIENTGDEPLFGIVFLCHADRPCHAHAFSHRPGEGNFCITTVRTSGWSHCGRNSSRRCT